MNAPGRLANLIIVSLLLPGLISCSDDEGKKKPSSDLSAVADLEPGDQSAATESGAGEAGPADSSPGDITSTEGAPACFKGGKLLLQMPVAVATPDITEVWQEGSGLLVGENPRCYSAGCIGRLFSFSGGKLSEVTLPAKTAAIDIWKSAAGETYIAAFGDGWPPKEVMLLKKTSSGYDSYKLAIPNAGDYITTLWGAGPNSILVAGHALHSFDGKSAKVVTHPGNSLLLFADIHGISATEAYAVGRIWKFVGVIYRFDGKSWTQVIPTGFQLDYLYGVWQAGAKDVHAVGKGGTLLHFNGTSWKKVSAGTTADLNAIWGSGPNDIYIVGDSGTILHQDGSGWRPACYKVPNKVDLQAVRGGSNGKVYIGGDRGTLLEF